MKPKLLLLVVPFVLAVLLQGCIVSSNAAKTYGAGTEHDCGGYGWTIALGSTTAALGIGSVLIFTVLVPSSSDSCGEEFCVYTEREIAEATGYVMIGFTAVLAVSTLIQILVSKECRDAKKAQEEFLSMLSPEEIQDYRRNKSIERCNELKSNAKSFPNIRKWVNYLSECKEFETNQTINKIVLQWVKWLLASGKRMSRQDNQGWTPLHYAAYTGHVKLVKYLLNKGAYPDQGDNRGKTPLDIAAEYGHEGVAKILREAGGGEK